MDADEKRNNRVGPSADLANTISRINKRGASMAQDEINTNGIMIFDEIHLLIFKFSLGFRWPSRDC